MEDCGAYSEACMTGHLNARLSFVFELYSGSRHIETIGAQNLLWPSVCCISHRMGSSPRAVPPADPIISGKMDAERDSLPVNKGRTSWPKANKKVIESLRNQKKKRSKQLLQRRVKRARQRVGRRTLDQARRSRNKRLASAAVF
jgi:hypothetical protein